MSKNKGEFNSIIKVIFTIGGIGTFMLASNSGREMSQYFGNLALYGYPFLAIVYAACLFSILSTKKVIWVWITFGWIFLDSILVAILFNLSFDSSEFLKSIVSDITLIFAISGFLFIKKDGKSGWSVLMDK